MAVCAFSVARNDEADRIREGIALHAAFCQQVMQRRLEQAETTTNHAVEHLGRREGRSAGDWTNHFHEFAGSLLAQHSAIGAVGILPAGASADPMLVTAPCSHPNLAAELRDLLMCGVSAEASAVMRNDPGESDPTGDGWLVLHHRLPVVPGPQPNDGSGDAILITGYRFSALFADLLPPDHRSCVRIRISDPETPGSGWWLHRGSFRAGEAPEIGFDRAKSGAVHSHLDLGSKRLVASIFPTVELFRTYRTHVHWWVLAAGITISLLLARYVLSLSARTAASEVDRAHHAAALESANRDLSRQLLQQQAVAETLHTLTQAIECSPVSVVITNAEGMVKYVNRKYTERTGSTKDALIGRLTPLLEGNGLGKESLVALKKAMQCGREWQLEISGKQPSGERLAEHVALAPIRSQDGEIGHYVFMHTDVTERDRLQQEFLQSQKMEVVGRLAGGVVHDLSNMLTVILGFSQIVQIELGEDNPLSQDIEEIIRVGERAAALNRQLLSFARTQSYQAEKMDVNQTLADMDRFLRRTLGEDVTLRTEFADLGGNIEIDPGQFNQLIMNLAVNARDAMPEGGALTVTTGVVDLPLELCKLNQIKPGRFVRLEVKDSGVGMPENVRERLFEPFFTTKPEGKGTGLGLSTVYGIVRRFHGAIEVLSTVGEGTTFRIYLPLCRAVRENAEGKRRAKVPRGTETVLLVEDDIDVRQLCMTLLVGLGYQVIEAGRAEEAIRIAMEDGDRIELIITDVVMPDLNGLDMVNQLRPFLPNVPVIYTTGFSDHPILDRHPGRTEGCLLSKPFSREKLGRTVRNALDQAGTSTPAGLQAVVS